MNKDLIKELSKRDSEKSALNRSKTLGAKDFQCTYLY